MTNTPDDQAMRRSYLVVSVTAVVLAFATLPAFGVKPALGVLAGGALAALNLYALTWSVSRLLAGRGGSFGGLAALKFVLLFGLTYLALQSGAVDGLPLMAGFSALPLGILLTSLFGGPHVGTQHLGATKVAPPLASQKDLAP